MKELTYSNLKQLKPNSYILIDTRDSGSILYGIEVLPEEFVKLIAEDTRAKIITSFREYGFTYISMDLIGYRTGSMNEVIDK